MSLGEKIKQIRREKSWSQDEFAYHAGIDGRQVSRYENGKVTPSIEVVIKIAKAFNISLDYLLLEDAPKKPLGGPRNKLAERIMAIEPDTLSEEDERSLLHFLSALEAKNKLKIVAANVK